MSSLIIHDLPRAEELDAKAMAAVQGGSIYVDGVYRGEGGLDVRPWPGGAPAWNVWPDGSRTPY